MKGNEQFIEPACHQVGADAIHITLRQSSLYTYFAASAWMTTASVRLYNHKSASAYAQYKKSENFCDVSEQSKGIISLNVLGFWFCYRSHLIKRCIAAQAVDINCAR